MSLTWALAFAFALGPLSADRTDSSCQLQLRETRMDGEIESDTETETTERTGKGKGQRGQQRSRWFRDCVDAFAEEGYQLTVPAPGPMSLVNHSNYDLYLQASRLCQDFLFCAYQGCTPPKEGACAALQEDKIRQFAGYPGKLTAQLRRCPPDNLPFSVVTAETVSDIIDGIKSAKQLGRTVSVKTSGHNYAGSSTFHGSVSINMANYEKYSKSNILECGTLPEPVPTSMSNQKAVCKLAAARGKLAVVRVGGGENWNEVYSAVYWYQFPSQTTRRYHVVGGAAGTVSAAGGWLQGSGLSGTTGMRIWGYGVDQLLQIEMVLSNSKHVRFMPSDWKNVNGKIYPQTLSVTGECNLNPVADESNWQWEPCDDVGLPVTFKQLWFAVRGGGGGTYGIVTSVYYQLHEQVNQQLEMDYHVVFTLPAVLPSCSQETCQDLVRSLWLQFLRDFFHPAGGAPWEDASPFCGSSNVNFDIFLGGGNVYCNGGTALNTFLGVWLTFVASAEQELLGVGLSQQDLELLETVQGGIFAFSLAPDWYPALLYTIPAFPWSPHMNQYPTQLPDNPTPATYPDNYLVDWNALLPVEWLYSERGLPTLLTLVKEGLGGPSTYILGSRTAVSDDGLTSVPEFQRKAGFMMFLAGGESVENFLRGTFDEYIGGKSSTKPFPGGTGYNHISAIEIGPLKDDWTKACPDSFSDREKKKKCISLQESVWGTERLAKLEAVKRRADPKHLFQCFDCVGFKGHRSHRPWKRKPVFCLRPGYAATCYKSLDHDPAGDVESMRKARNELSEELQMKWHFLEGGHLKKIAESGQSMAKALKGHKSVKIEGAKVLQS